jgi:hypothetical protein
VLSPGSSTHSRCPCHNNDADCVKLNDPATFVSMTLMFFLIAALASWAPAWRAARLDPTAALREE